jgi:hypothetical protein
MHRNPRILATGALLVATVVFAARGLAAADTGSTAHDEKVYNSLKSVINEGAALYNQGDATGSYRVFQGALMAVGPLLEQRPALQKSIEEGLAKAKEAPSCRHKAHELRKVLDKVRGELSSVQLPPPTSSNKAIEGGKGKAIESGKDKVIEGGKGKVIEGAKDNGKVIEKKAEKTIEKKDEKTIEKKDD